MNERSIALVTCSGLPELSTDDQALARALTAADWSPAAVRWDAAMAWDEFDAIIVRSPWDYYKRYAEFVAWLDELAARKAPVLNPVTTLRWNAQKDYLRDLERDGVVITPTVWLSQGSTTTIASIMGERGWTEIVVKPTISATAFETFRVTAPASAEVEHRVASLVAQRDLMIQPYLPAIADQGEYSLLFFGGIYSHAVLKRPRAGDFRVQSDFGGSVESVVAAPWLVAQAAAALAAAPDPTLYARVDGCIVDGQFMLMELELVEPSLFFLNDPAATTRCIEALERMRVYPANPVRSA